MYDIIFIVHTKRIWGHERCSTLTILYVKFIVNVDRRVANIPKNRLKIINSLENLLKF